VVRWRCVDLERIVKERFGIDCDEGTIGRVLKKQLGFSHLGPRPQPPARDEDALAAFKKTSRDTTGGGRPRRRSPEHADRDLVPRRDAGRPEERPRAAVGATRLAATPAAGPALRQRAPVRRGLRPARDAGAALVLPYADTWAMQRHLDEIGRHVAPGAHAILILDKAGWHTTGKLTVPPNISLLPLPARSPEPNPTGNIWQYLRQTWLSNRVLANYEAVVAACCEVWNKLAAEAGRIRSIARRDWAVIGQ
jgi:transposase